MRKSLLLLCLIAASVVGCASQPSARERAHRATVTVVTDTGTCSGTIIGVHALLSATHCFVGAHTLAVNGRPVAVLDSVSDGYDHTILVLDCDFADRAEHGGEPQQASAVFIYGNPAGLRDMYREGRVAGSVVKENVRITLYDLNGYFGDSGSGIFDEQGRLVGVVSLVLVATDGGIAQKFMASLPLRFTAAQWEAASKA